VKNRNTLPLKTPKMLSVFGYSAKAPDQSAPGVGTGGRNAWALGLLATDTREILLRMAGLGDAPIPPIAINGTILSGGGSGSTTPSAYLSPLDALNQRAYKDSTAIFHDLTSAAPAVDPASDARIMMGNAWAGEGYDQSVLRVEYTDNLI